MKILVTGACGFVGSALIHAWVERGEEPNRFIGIDNFTRPGSETNRLTLRRLGVLVRHADTRLESDLAECPRADVVIEAAANPSVLAGIDGRASSRQVVEHNLIGTVNTLEYCRRHGSALLLLSTSRVYSIAELNRIPLQVGAAGFEPDLGGDLPAAVTRAGIGEAFSTRAPISLYGATKLASEQLALEYGSAFGFPVWIDRCGVLAGPGQFGRADQGIFAYWINSWLRRRPLVYRGFGGRGHQVRDCLHPADLVPLLARQLSNSSAAGLVANVGGGRSSAISLHQLSEWCRARFGDHEVGTDPETRPFDLPWVVLDAGLAAGRWDWQPTRRTDQILEEIAGHAEQHPEWLELSGDQ